MDYSSTRKHFGESVFSGGAFGVGPASAHSLADGPVVNQGFYREYRVVVRALSGHDTVTGGGHTLGLHVFLEEGLGVLPGAALLEETFQFF